MITDRRLKTHWTPTDVFTRDGNYGECWIVHTGRVCLAFYWIDTYYFDKRRQGCYSTECIRAVANVLKPPMPKEDIT
jgi:hypothetical protein